MNYVLISLPGDEATRDADDFARWIAERRSPLHRFHEEAPDLEQVRQAVETCGCVLIFGHNGGGGLRAVSGGKNWVDAKELGRICKDARVYAFACNTLGSHSQDEVKGLGTDAVQAGVLVFAGHPTAVPPSTDDHPRGKFEQEVRKAIANTIFLFLEGETNEQQLRIAAERSFKIAESKFSAARFGAATAIRAAMAHLRVVTRS